MRRSNIVLAWLLIAIGPALASTAQPVAGADTGKTVQAVLLSDIHFDPFRDLSKVARLAAVPAEQWEPILSEKPPEAGAAERELAHQAMMVACSAVAEDTDHGLLRSTLAEASKHAGKGAFVTVSGDLLVHQFACRFRWATRTSAPETVGKFAAETARYVMLSVEAAFPGQPVYFALGNNDSGCGDYRLNGHDSFLAQTSGAMIRGLRGVSVAEATQARIDYEAGGFYAVTLGLGPPHTRLLVVDDIYESKEYAPCAGQAADAVKGQPTAGDPRLVWLNAQLDAAVRRNEKVWVMGHIPPGPDVYSTVKHYFTMCGQPPKMFLGSSALADAMVNHAQVIQLAIFGHTHMDEWRLLQRSGQPGAVSVKLVPSVSPVHGNQPAFTVATVASTTGLMQDYAVYTSATRTLWTREYGFRDTYHQPEFSALTLRNLVGQLQADKTADRAESKAYVGFFSAGRPQSPLYVVWPQYGCALSNDRADDFKTCLCPTK